MANVSSRRAPSGWKRPPPKVQKPNRKLPKSEEDGKARKKENQPLASNTIRGEESYCPYREFGYNQDGGEEPRPEF